MSSAHTTAPRVGSLCTGYGGLDMAVELVLGGRLAWYAETDRHATTVLRHRWPSIPNLGDIRTIDWTKVQPVDIVTAGFPCLNDTLGGPSSGGVDAVAG
ncbi:C-5 cytosine-specific DNA methylase [Micromonospora nigra]|uniref:C-5 cytosine-specific DNA methylase n=1 Tax=Micromonospora nigra TaxID=145857 RepID=A0A1C6S9Q5_9ACTN|nr:DNA cytosine methyltransferase [Micromonospora nigra]SCL26198.1 C-5 cytosine-specific DNA methylase [Micromonospora nigra]